MKSYIQQLLCNNHTEPSDVGQGCQIAVKSYGQIDGIFRGQTEFPSHSTTKFG